MSGVVFLTGATGFLGSWIAQRLVQDTNHTIIALVRAEDKQAAMRRLSRAWWDWPELVGAIGARVEAVCGDVSLPHLGLDDATCASLVHRITHIIHTAADLRLDGPISELRRTNVQGVVNVLELARAIHKDHGLTRFSHISTAYVAGRRKGPVPEDALTDEFGFANGYELSKYEGELLVQAAKGELPISVFRPGMIVGDSRTGAIKTFNTFYFPVRLYLTGKIRSLPSSPDLPANIIPVDYVAEAVVRLTFEPVAEGLNFHLTAPYASLPTAKEAGYFIRQWAREHLGLKLPRPLFIPLPLPAIAGRYEPGREAKREERGMVSSLVTILPYLGERRQFQRDNVDRLLGPYQMKWREFLPHILEYAVHMGFLHRSERTVHEQILYRLEGRGRRVAYHDVVEGKIVTRGAGEVRRDMLAAAGALRSLGIGRGDRVAIVGLNSTRYLTLDVAIGLLGAASVPLDYTSPPAELDAIIQASGSRLLLIGAPRLLERLSELTAQIPIVSFCRGQPPSNLPRKVMPWDEFLALGAGCEMPTTAPVTFRDLATLDYTFGTTDQPKGAAFTHGDLRRMGEAVASLFPWKARNSPASYLSFLPMRHVLEGILATYSPYYAPTSLDLYFLEDFRELQRTLPRVRPMIFFAVPFVYEKIWEAMRRSRIGRIYLGAREGLLKRMLRQLLRWQLLRKAGLDRCAQFIVVSAPSSDALLRAFHELGIETHNASGLTAVPLVTLNRLGVNRIGTANGQ